MAPWAVFDEVQGKKFTDFNEVRHQIEVLTDKMAGERKNIVDIPIVLNVYSPTCPDLTLIDLPGITRIPLKGSDQPDDIERVTTEMAKKYCLDERTIILCVIPANVDLSTSEALKYTREWDPKGERSVGVVTKIDIMDKGTNCKKVLMNQEIQLKLGYVGVKNRSQQDINDKIRVQSGLEVEKQWFMNHPVYRSLPKECYGTDTLTLKLSRVMYAQIRLNLPKILQEVQDKLAAVEERIRDLGTPLPTSDMERMQLLFSMINAFVLGFKNKISGKCELKSLQMSKDQELAGGAKIKAAFFALYDIYAHPQFRAIDHLKDQEISNSITLHEGDNLSGFPSVEVFYYLIQPEIEKLKEPALGCLTDIYYYLEQLAHTLLEKSFIRFPSMIGELLAVAQQIMGEEREKTRYIVESLIDSEVGYMFTNDSDYQGKRTDIIPRMDESNRSLDGTKVYVMELRERVESYFRLVVRNIRDSVPKAIGTFLVRAVLDKLQLEMATRLLRNEQVKALMSEPPSVAAERKRLLETREILKQAIKAIQRDPEYASASPVVSTFPTPRTKTKFSRTSNA